MNKQTNRYGDEWWWTEESENIFKFNMTGNSLKYARMGGELNEERTKMETIHMFDPSGGPYIAIGGKIGDKVITRIWTVDDTFYVEVSDG